MTRVGVAGGRRAGRTARSGPRLPAWLGSLAAALAIGAFLGTAALPAQQVPEWNGYVQLRYGRADPSTGLVVRRAKLWLEGSVPRVDPLAFKVQGIFRNGSSGAFVLQDVFAEYRRHAIALRLGQFVPDFSLERAQPDYLIPLMERAAVVETVIPGGRTMGRDIGAEVLLTPGSGWLHLAGGLFDGGGANHAPAPEGDYLATGRLVLSRTVGGTVRGALGTSVAVRETRGMDVGVLSSAPGPFAGRDIRWGGEAHLQGKTWDLQGEYLHADLAGQTSDGFYLLGTLAVDLRDRVAASVERLDAPGAPSQGGPWFVAGYTRYAQIAPGDGAGSDPRNARYPTKVMTDLRVRSEEGRATVGAAVQVQVFLH